MQTILSLETQDVQNEIDRYLYDAFNFQKYFENYLITVYGITGSQLNEILKEVAPEHFV